MSSGGSGTLLRAHYITPYRWCANTGELRRPAGTLISIFAATTTSTAPWRWPRRPLLPKERAKKLFWRRRGGTGCPHRPVSTFFRLLHNLRSPFGGDLGAFRDSGAPSCKEAFRGSQDPLRSFQCRQQSIVSARDDVSTPTEGHNGCGKRASRLFQPTCTSVHEHDHKQMGTQSCPSEYARSLPTESPRLRERSKTLASSQKAPFARAPLWMQSMSTMRFVPDRTRTADEVTPNSATLADLHAGCQALDARCWQQPVGPCHSSGR